MPTDKPAPLKQLTDEQIGAFRQAFAVFDKNGDGKISFEEMRQVMSEMKNAPQADKDVQAAMAELDVNGDGTIDFQEFLSVMTVKMNAQNAAATNAASPRASGNAGGGGNEARPPMFRQVSSAFVGGGMPMNGAAGASVLMTLCCSLIITAGGIALTAYQLYLYVEYKDKPCEKELTRYCLASGILGAIGNFVAIVQLFANCVIKDPDPEHPFRKLVAQWNQLSGCASLGILITGSAWAYSMNRDNHICPAPLFDFVWGYTLFCWVFAAAIICCVCVLFIVAGGNTAALRAIQNRA